MTKKTPTKLDTQTETRVVALIARGDTYISIKNQLEEEGIQVSMSLLAKIKDRNSQALSYITKKLVDHETTNARRIMTKARDVVEKQLDDTISIEKARSDAFRDVLSGSMTKDEYESIFRLKVPPVAFRDAVAASKEFFNQSQIEAGKPTSITETPEQAKIALQKVLEAINSGDERAIAEAIFVDV